MAIIASLGVRLGLNSAEFKAGLDDATKNTRQFEANQKKAMKNAQQASAELGATMGKLAIGVGIASAALAKIFQKSDEIADMADAFDASIGSIVGMGKALEMSGGKAENLGNILTKLSQNAQAAKDGSDDLRKSFADIGVSASEVQNLHPDELFERVAQQLAKIEDPTKRAATAMDLLGKSAKNIDWSKYVDEYKQIADPDLAAAIQESAEAWDNVQKAMGQVYYMAVKLVQPIAALINYLADLKSSYQEFKEQGGTINFDPDNPMAAGQEFAGTGKEKKSNTPEAKKRDIPGGGYKVASQNEEKRAVELAKIREAFNIRVMEIAKIEEQIAREGELIGLTQQEAEMKKLQWKFEDENLKFQMDLEKQINEEKAKGLNADAQKIAMLRQQQETYSVLSQVMLENAKIAEESNIMQIRDRQVLTDVEKQGFDSMIDNLAAFGEQSKAAFTAWKAMAIAQTIIDTYKGAQGAFASLSTIPIVGPALGAAAAVAAIAAGLARVNAIRATEYQGRAKGGAVLGGQPYLVGENGPEVIVPHGSGGTVIPNNRLGNGMGSGPQQVFNGPYIANMSAIDTQSATAFLAKNKAAVWAANQSATRGMPASR